MDSKKCSRCGVEKCVSEFNKNRSTKDGYQRQCNSCRRAGYEANKEAKLAYQNKYYQDNRDECLARVRKRYWEDYDRVREGNRSATRKWRANNPGYHFEPNRKRREILRNSPREEFTRWQIFDRDGWVCQICQEPVDASLKFPDPMSITEDHIVAVMHPEFPGHLWTNVQTAHLVCNERKGS